MIKNIVLKGGGTRGVAYLGPIFVMEGNGMLAGIEKVAGTSAGAITALLLCLRYTAKEIQDIVNATNFKSFEDGINPFQAVGHYGAHSGNNFLAWAKQCIVGKGFNANASFADLHSMRCRDLHVFATDTDTQSLQRFSYEDTPNVIVAEAVRASMSIPFFFEAFQFSNGIPNNHIFADGGCLFNYPISAFDKDGDNPETLGFFLHDVTGQKPVATIGFGHPLQYAKNVFEAILDAQDVELANDAEALSRTVMIDSLGISSTDFGITDLQQKALFDSGTKAMNDYLLKQAAA